MRPIKHIFGIFLSIVLFFSLTYNVFTNYVYAQEANTIQITHNFQRFISLKKFSKITQYYKSGKLSFGVTSQDGLQLIERNNQLVFWYPIGTHSADGELIIHFGEKTYTIPIALNTKKDFLDYSITQDMFQLSLQEKSLSCESSATSDIIASLYGKSIHENEIIQALPKSLYYQALPEKHPDGITIWGNPHIGFVGYINHSGDILAKQKLMTGYGVYEAPIAEVYKKIGLNTQILNRSYHNDILTPHKHLEYILKELKNGSMIQLWGDWCTRESMDDGILESKNDFYTRNIGLTINAKNSCYNIDQDRTLQWKYYNDDGKLTDHTGLDGQHAFILLGWKGDISNPSHIRVWDTDTGYHLYPTEEWMRKWEKMDYRSIVVTKKE